MTGSRIPLTALLGVAVTCGILIAHDGGGAEGMQAAIRVSARLAAILLALALSASALHVFLPSPATLRLRRERRYVGLAFGSAHLFHLALLVAQGVVHPEPFRSQLGAAQLIGGGIAYLFVVAMMLTSTEAAMRRMGRAWSRLHTIGGWYLLLLFTRSYLLRVLDGKTAYVPLLALMAGVVLLRIAAALRRRAVARVSGSPVQ